VKKKKRKRKRKREIQILKIKNSWISWEKTCFIVLKSDFHKEKLIIFLF